MQSRGSCTLDSACQRIVRSVGHMPQGACPALPDAPAREIREHSAQELVDSEAYQNVPCNQISKADYPNKFDSIAGQAGA